MPSILEQIVAFNREALRKTKLREPFQVLQARMTRLPKPLDFEAALRGDNLRVIAEVKSASPSAGELRKNLRPVALARRYAAAGAAAISVLTEKRHFGGSLTRLASIREALDGPSGFHVAKSADRPPLLRKDFIFDPYQIYQARAYGGDALLLIVAMLDRRTLEDLLELTHAFDMEAMIETHDEAQVERALSAGARVIGINNRDLHNFHVDLETTHRLRPRIPDDVVVVSESGIKTRDDMLKLRDWGVNAVLIGETLVTARSVKAKMQELMP